MLVTESLVKIELIVVHSFCCWCCYSLKYSQNWVSNNIVVVYVVVVVVDDNDDDVVVFVVILFQKSSI